jgi:hypothetical protein
LVTCADGLFFCSLFCHNYIDLLFVFHRVTPPERSPLADGCGDEYRAKIPQYIHISIVWLMEAVKHEKFYMLSVVKDAFTKRT